MNQWDDKKTVVGRALEAMKYGVDLPPEPTQADDGGEKCSNCGAGIKRLWGHLVGGLCIDCREQIKDGGEREREAETCPLPPGHEGECLIPGRPCPTCDQVIPPTSIPGEPGEEGWECASEDCDLAGYGIQPEKCPRCGSGTALALKTEQPVAEYQWRSTKHGTGKWWPGSKEEVESHGKVGCETRELFTRPFVGPGAAREADLRFALENAEGSFKGIRANLKYGSGDKVEASIGLAEFATGEISAALASQPAAQGERGEPGLAERLRTSPQMWDSAGKCVFCATPFDEGTHDDGCVLGDVLGKLVPASTEGVDTPKDTEVKP